MITYLTKIHSGKTHHFKITVENNGVEIAHGIFYEWLDKYFDGCGDNDAAVTRQKQMVEEKIKEGFQVTEFIKTPENTVDVYDKAKWHYGGNFPKELEDFHGYIHMGMFLGWLIDNDLVSDEFRNNHNEEIKQFKQQRLTGSQVYQRCCDGVLMVEDVNELGNRFTLPYLDFDTGQYLGDYEKTLAKNLPSLYHVMDTWDNYAKLKRVLNTRFLDWKNQGYKRPIWKFW